MTTKMKNQFYLLLTLLISLVNSTQLAAQFQVDVEVGALLGGFYNEVRSPSEGGTDFDFLSDDFTTYIAPLQRVRLGGTINERHTIIALAAPLTVYFEGNSGRPDINYRGRIFRGDQPLLGVFKFNSYRLTYRYNIIVKEKIKFGAGFTAKLRDASVALDNGELRIEDGALGFVPLINLYLKWNATERFGFIVDYDGLITPIQYGRASDLLLAAFYSINENLSLKAGWRFVEGGSDRPENYNIAWLNFVSVGMTWGF